MKKLKEERLDTMAPKGWYLDLPDEAKALHEFINYPTFLILEMN